MSSSSKQQKRAKRAKAKAKQLRIQRNSDTLAAPNDDWPDNHLYFERNAEDKTREVIRMLNQSLLMLIETHQPDDQLPRPVRELFEDMQAAEATDLEDMIYLVVDGPLSEPHPVQNLLDGKLFQVMALYWNWSEGLDEDAVEQRMKAYEFDSALSRVLAPYLNSDEQDAAQEVDDYMDSIIDRTLIEAYLELMQAEAISQEELLFKLLQSPLLMLEDEFGEPLDEEGVAEEMASMLIGYWEWSEDLDETDAEARMTTEQFAQDLIRATERFLAISPAP
ncbi:hypothetical protein NJC40_05150 [Pseudomonas sp. 21LCFQ02]|uniref:hypothetical protein n=1 Tax=Pseudomonas sp. 21LCFQ02 TaxID=2957505 RepID=UPI00209B8BE0|nr:hypothetical protein [Pseudomonas sp. 21LCFQ02]MCO8167164.1 hypothetical protein [Pseudomonas sp. 21LCFQ02]